MRIPGLAVFTFCGLFDWTIASTSFTITGLPPAGSSILQVLPSTDYLEVYAGVPYSYMLITSSAAFFGTSAAQVSGKLVASGGDCDAAAQSLMEVSPFDGLTRPTQLTQLMTRWSATKYDIGGTFTICVDVASALTLLPVTIYSHGVTSTSLKLFCRFSLTEKCTVVLPGHGLSGFGDARIGLIPYSSATCGSSTLSTPFNQTRSVATISKSTFEEHSFGFLNATTTLASYKACYCPSYQASGGVGGIVCTDLSANFVQAVGNLILVKSATFDPITAESAAVYSRVKVDLHVLCGSGGCATDSSPRMKIVDTNKFNAKPYYESSAGCRTALQSTRYLGPSNCQPTSSTNCELTRSNVGDSTKVVFSGIQLESALMNNVGVGRTFDVCYCDSSCSKGENWFLVDTFELLPLTTRFTQLAVPVTRLAINILSSVEIKGSTPGGFRTAGSQSREMKILSDMSKLVDSSACMQTAQSASLVGGHECYTVTNCDAPVSSSRTAHSYGSDLIQIKQAGWIAVCFCNAQCRASTDNWSVVGRMLVAGPKGDQSWQATTDLPFSLSIDGYGLRAQDSLKIIPLEGDCQSTAQPGYVFTNTTGSLLSVGSITTALDGHAVVNGGNGTILVFSESHGLVDFDRIALSGVSTGNSAIDEMFNSDHLVAVVTSDRVWIDVQFNPGEFPSNINFTAASWSRSNKIGFQSIVVLKAGSYRVCWMCNSSRAPAGSLTVRDPDFSVGRLDWESTALSTEGNITLAFTIAPTPLYATPPDTVRIVFSKPAIVVPAGHGSPSWTGSACANLITNFYRQENQLIVRDCRANIDNSRGAPQYNIQVSMFNSDLRANGMYRIRLPVYLASVTSIMESLEGPIQIWLMGPGPQRVVQKIYVKPY